MFFCLWSELGEGVVLFGVELFVVVVDYYVGDGEVDVDDFE